MKIHKFFIVDNNYQFAAVSLNELCTDMSRPPTFAEIPNINGGYVYGKRANAVLLDLIVEGTGACHTSLVTYIPIQHTGISAFYYERLCHILQQLNQVCGAAGIPLLLITGDNGGENILPRIAFGALFQYSLPHLLNELIFEISPVAPNRVFLLAADEFDAQLLVDVNNLNAHLNNIYPNNGYITGKLRDMIESYSCNRARNENFKKIFKLEADNFTSILTTILNNDTNHPARQQLLELTILLSHIQRLTHLIGMQMNNDIRDEIIVIRDYMQRITLQGRATSPIPAIVSTLNRMLAIYQIHPIAFPLELCSLIKHYGLQARFKQLSQQSSPSMRIMLDLFESLRTIVAATNFVAGSYFGGERTFTYLPLFHDLGQGVNFPIPALMNFPQPSHANIQKAGSLWVAIQNFPQFHYQPPQEALNLQEVVLAAAQADAIENARDIPRLDLTERQNRMLLYVQSH